MKYIVHGYKNKKMILNLTYLGAEFETECVLHIGKYDTQHKIMKKKDCYEEVQMVWTCGESEGNPGKHQLQWRIQGGFLVARKPPRP